MKKFFSSWTYLVITIFTLLSPLASCSHDHEPPTPAEAVMRDGIWEGTGEGRGGTILVRITVTNHIITDAKAVSQSESSFAQEALNKVLINAIGRTDYLSLETDGITGATLTSQGVIDALTMAIAAAKGERSEEETGDGDCSCDIVVVGAGGAGLCAAVEAASQGCKVIVVEKQGIVGGNTNYSTGGINAAETSVQRGLGIYDSKELFYDDTMKGGHYLNDSSLVRSFVENGPLTIDWLISLGTDLSDVGLMGGSSVKRTHRPQGGTAIGPHLMKVLKEVAHTRNVEIRTNNKVTGLISQNNRIGGVNIEKKDGSTYSILAKVVIIATGGFGANLEMVTRYCPTLRGMATLNHQGATGDAFTWIKAVGGYLIDLDKIQIHPTSEYVNHILITEAVRGNGAILVNSDGQRFVNEMQTRDSVSAAILSQRGGMAYLLFDQQVRQSLASIETYQNQGVLISAATIAKLADKIGIPRQTLTSTMSRYTEMQFNGKDDDFGRAASAMTAPLNVPPFYAVGITPAIHHTMGGIKVDPDMHVLREDGTVLPGLYAAGEVTGGLHGANRLGGNGVGDVVVNGKIAGRNAAKEILGL